MSWLSCKRFCERCSQKLDSSLGLRDRIGYWFHYYLCFTCRRFQRQVKQIEHVFDGMREQELDHSKTCEPLSKEAKQRIKDCVCSGMSPKSPTQDPAEDSTTK